MTTGQGSGNEPFVLYERLLGAKDSAITVADARRPGHPIVWANVAFEKLTGWSSDEVIGRDCRFFLHEEDPAAARGLSESLEFGRAFRGAIPARRRDGQAWVDEVTSTPLRDSGGDLRHCVLVHEDVTAIVDPQVQGPAEPAQAADKRRVAVTGRLARSVLDSLEEGVVLFGEEGEIVDCNESALRIFGLRERDVIGRDVPSIGLRLHFEDGTLITPANRPERRTMITGEPARDLLLRWDVTEGDTRWLLVNYTPLDGDDGPRVVVASIADVTERRRAEQQVAFLAYHDPLTELPNRTLLAEHLEQGLARARRYGRSVALLYIDLDGFKMVNDSFGHAAGDELLSRIAARLREGTRSADLLARQGGDEFLLLLTDIEGDVQAVGERAAQTIRGALEAPFVLRGAEVQMGASVGIGIFPRDAQSARGLLQFADQAMYRAKGPSRRPVTSVTRDSDPLERLAMTTRLRNALAAGEFVLHWQPVFSLVDDKLVSVEALLRWDDPERGLITAGDFIPVAEQMGLTGRIDSWVVDSIARQVRAWREEGLTPRVSFNLSGRDLREPSLLAAVTEKLTAGDLDPATFTVEVSEASAIEEGGRVEGALRELHEAGLGIAIDRFNSGLSSLRRLRDLPLSALKIDSSCVTAAAEDEAAASLVTGIIGFAAALGVTAVAEGVETEAQRRFLVDNGCPSAQGFHLARPAGTAETTALLHRERESASG
jgi:diguanylate cyclase (GGDEF)-like protein/PAS domain S-box-containing protein